MAKDTTGSGAQELQERLARIQSQIGDPKAVRNRQLTEALTAMREALEEVEVAERELARRSDELLAAQEALEVERHRYRELFELAPVGYLVTDEAGTVQDANLAVAALLNTSWKALRGKPLVVFVAPSNRGELRDLLHRVRRQPAERGFELVLQPRDLQPRVALVSVRRDEDRIGKPSRLLWILQDISERREAERALHDSQERLRHSQRLEAIGRLAGGVAHSFNNLLAAIAFHVELILGGRSGGEELLRHASEIQRAGERAASLARQLLAFGRKQVLQPRRLTLHELIAHLEPMLRRLLGQDIDVEIATDPEAGAIHADLGQIEQVILNLVGNARDAMPHGGRLTLATGTAEIHEGEPPGSAHLAPGAYVTLTVSDTGMGMPPEVVAHLFEPFFTTKERDKGTGLGLATVYGIVRQSGGDVRIETEPGKGTSFTILLPRAGSEGEVEFPPPPELAPARGTEVVLLVEDEDNIREPAIEILEGHGYTVLPASDGVKALEVARAYPGPIQVMITDVIMPNLSGGRLAEELLPLRPDMRVIYMSGYPEDSITRHGALEPRHRFLQKPFPPSVLLRTVREVLEAVVE
ncbi:MAG TPA: ATP-binding protein [Thermoanaerobaculia bacterium]